MIKVKEMPHSEKYVNVIESINTETVSVPSFLKNRKGEHAATEFKNNWQTGVETIPDGASYEEKYEIAYRNWIRGATYIFGFIRKELGEDGIEDFKRTEAEVLKKKNSGPAIVMLAFMRIFSKSLAFSMTARQMAYKLQWLSPYTISELTGQRLVFDIPSCKILDFPDSEDICHVGCQGMYPIWLADQFKVNMRAERQGNSCKLMITPI